MLSAYKFFTAYFQAIKVNERVNIEFKQYISVC